jgi:glycosyltransferase involved in cell wall biosynthesis
MQEACCVLNSSISEGMPNAVMEAMTLGTPVVVRQNSGNCALVQHGITGTVYTTAKQALCACVVAGHLWLNRTAATHSSAPSEALPAACSAAAEDETQLNPANMKRMAIQGQQHMQANFSETAEETAWMQLVRPLLVHTPHGTNAGLGAGWQST